jgi:NADH:ubiquinone oxidoreductase subunit E
MEKECQKILNKYHKNKGNVISLLQEMQESFGYIREDTVNCASNLYGVATFYAQFYLKPRGKNIVTACCGTACHVKGSGNIINKIREDLKIPAGETTSKDGKFTIESVACVGACSIAPVFIANKKVYGKMTSDKAARMIEEVGNG